MILLLFGPPGCGKGTQAAFLAERFHIPAISTGEMIRAECKAGTELGKAACSIISQGGFVSDEVVNDIVASRTARSDCANGFLLDGYPRTVPQAVWFDGLLRDRGLASPLVIHIDVADEAVVARLCSRRQCPTCLRIYNLISLPPKTPGVCDCDGTTLLTRDDDCESVIRQRLRTYDELTGPILNWYGSRAAYRVDGSQRPDQVEREIEAFVLSRAGAIACPAGV